MWVFVVAVAYASGIMFKKSFPNPRTCILPHHIFPLFFYSFVSDTEVFGGLWINFSMLCKIRAQFIPMLVGMQLPAPRVKKAVLYPTGWSWFSCQNSTETWDCKNSLVVKIEY